MIAIIPDVHGRQFWKDVIPRKDEFEKIMNQYMCEYEYDFLGFLEVYYAASIFVPKSN